MNRRTFLATVGASGLAGCLGGTPGVKQRTVETTTTRTTTSTTTTTEMTRASNKTTKYRAWPDAIPRQNAVYIDDLVEAELRWWTYKPSVRVVKDGDLVEIKPWNDVFFQPSFIIRNLREEEFEKPDPSNLTVKNGWYEYDFITEFRNGVGFENLREDSKVEIHEPLVFWNSYDSIAAGSGATYDMIYDISLPEPVEEELICEFDWKGESYRFGLLKED